MINPTDKSRLDSMEQKVNELMRRIADLERRVATIERAPQAERQMATQPAPQSARPTTNVEHNYLRRAIASARKEYEKNYR